MHIFVTGGTGTIGSAVVAELLANDHTVLALARSDISEQTLKHAGAERAAWSVGRPRRAADRCRSVRRCNQCRLKARLPQRRRSRGSHHRGKPPSPCSERN